MALKIHFHFSQNWDSRVRYLSLVAFSGRARPYFRKNDDGGEVRFRRAQFLADIHRESSKIPNFLENSGYIMSRMGPNQIKSNQINSYPIISYHIVLYHIISSPIISDHIISYPIISYHTIRSRALWRGYGPLPRQSLQPGRRKFFAWGKKHRFAAVLLLGTSRGN